MILKLCAFCVDKFYKYVHLLIINIRSHQCYFNLVVFFFSEKAFHLHSYNQLASSHHSAWSACSITLRDPSSHSAHIKNKNYKVYLSWLWSCSTSRWICSEIRFAPNDPYWSCELASLTHTHIPTQNAGRGWNSVMQMLLPGSSATALRSPRFQTPAMIRSVSRWRRFAARGLSTGMPLSLSSGKLDTNIEKITCSILSSHFSI